MRTTYSFNKHKVIDIEEYYKIDKGDYANNIKSDSDNVNINSSDSGSKHRIQKKQRRLAK